MDRFRSTNAMMSSLSRKARRRRIARWHYQPWPLRLVAGVLIAVELLVPCNSQVLIAAELLFAQTTESPAPAPASQPQGPAPVLTPQNVTVNRTTPQVSPPPAQPVFSNPPTDLEVFRAQVFADPLVPTGATTPEENKALALSLLAFLTARATTTWPRSNSFWPSTHNPLGARRS